MIFEQRPEEGEERAMQIPGKMFEAVHEVQKPQDRKIPGMSEHSCGWSGVIKRDHKERWGERSWEGRAVSRPRRAL